ncbi:sensor histidine kinase [Paraburkholderia oxyphila]|uniref:sensor histidine kinase n=1 Tax=Paraburkholderia oxyphila TaxID=614212 RepID=UPI000A5FDDD2|nr:ATP-binding protein [Paraburkholderia oxyphila]
MKKTKSGFETIKAGIVAGFKRRNHALQTYWRQLSIGQASPQPALAPPRRFAASGAISAISDFGAKKRAKADLFGALSGFARHLSPPLRNGGDVAADMPALRQSNADCKAPCIESGLRDALDLVPVALFAIDERDQIVYANPPAAALFGYRREALVARSVTVLFPELCVRDMLAALERASVSAGSRPELASHALIAKRCDGGGVPVAARTSACVVDGARALLMAIAERNDAEELHRSRQELTHLTRISALGELAGSLAHELNQPLTAILSNAQAAQRFLDADPINLDELRETLNDIVQDNCRASEIIRKIRTLVRQGDDEMRTLDVGSIVRDVTTLVHSDTIIRGVQVALEIADDLPVVRGDRVQLQQVVLNLLLNSFDAIRECSAADRVVTVRVSVQPDGAVCMMVSDRGQGLAVGQIDKVFKPFFTSKPQGLGLGLSISRSIVAGHGGRIWAENNPDRGATFYVTLPAENPEPQYLPVEQP